MSAACPPQTLPPPAPRAARPHRGPFTVGVRAPSPTLGATVRLATLVMLVLIGGAVFSAIVVRARLAAPARGWLHYTFPGVPSHGGVAVWLLAHNLRALLGVFGLLIIAQVAARAPQRPNVLARTLRWVGELVLAGPIAANVLAVGAGVGAYGPRMARALLPHGPMELAAFAVAITLYLQGRHRALPARHLVFTATASVALLAGAAVLETFVTL